MMISKRTGFTLIELLVVIAIIAILAAILFPVFARARAKAHQASCLSNTKQTALSFLMYTSDYDGFFVTSNWDHYSPAQPGYWWHPVWPYVETRLLDCPSTDPTPAGQQDWRNDFSYNVDQLWEGRAPCIGMAGHYDDFHAGGPLHSAPANTARVPNPTEVIMFWEHNCTYSVVGWMWGYFAGEHIYPGNHNNGAGMHYAFLDGHAKYMTTEDAPLRNDPDNIVTWHGITFCRGYE